jgi:hypothetical protein
MVLCEYLDLEGVPGACFPTMDRLGRRRSLTVHTCGLRCCKSAVSPGSRALPQHARSCAGKATNDHRCSTALPEGQGGRAPILADETEVDCAAARPE